MRLLLLAALVMAVAGLSPMALEGHGSALRLRGGYGDDGGYGGGGDYGDNGGYEDRGGGYRGRGYRGRGRGRGGGRGYGSRPPEGPIDELKVYVGGISWNIDDQGLLEAFSEFGQCEAKIMVDKYTGRSRGFGFVTYQDPAACSAAIEAMNGRELDGRTITCNNARQRTYDTEGGEGGGDAAAGGGGQQMDGDGME